MSESREFFREKRSWSKYKDLILDYYLRPYLMKVARIGRPIVVVDCFAGAGRYDDGEMGSPLIIGQHLEEAQSRGAEVRGFFIEADADVYPALAQNTSDLTVPFTLGDKSFRSYSTEIAELAETHTVFLYVDPIRPGHLRFEDLVGVYEKIRIGNSVEALINFLSTGFVRRALGLLARIDRLDTAHPEVLACDEIAGGNYWQEVVRDDTRQRVKIDKIADGYGKQLRSYFRWVLGYPIREHYHDEQPKYHLVFGSRSTDAVDLMNRAMVKSRREFVGAFFVDGHLFPNQPEAEVVDEAAIAHSVLDTVRLTGRTTWKLLRVTATVRNPCIYTDSEWNGAIKQLIRRGKLASTCDAQRITEDAYVWLPGQSCHSS